MTNPGITSPLEIDTWPIRTVRCAGMLIIVSSLINLANLKLVADVPALPALAYTLFDLAVGCALTTFTFTIIFREHWQSITWVGSALIIASDGVTGTIHGEITMFLITVMLMMMGSGALLPWSVRWQGSFNIFCVLAWSAMRARSGGHDPEEAAEWVGILCAAAIAQAITGMRERYTREHERSERKIRESEEKLRKVFEVSSDVITISSMDGRYIDVNPAFELTGYTRAEAIGTLDPKISVWPSPAERKRFQDEIMA